MFGKEKTAHLELRSEDGFYKLIVDYYGVKERKPFRRQLHQALVDQYEELFLQVDSNFINHQLDGREGPWIEKLVESGTREGLVQECMRFKREKRPVFGGFFGGKNPIVGYRYGVFLKKESLERIIKSHDEIDMGLHYGVKANDPDKESILRLYCTGMIDEYNFDKYYSIDVYDYEMVGRAVLKSSSKETLRNTAVQLAETLGIQLVE